MFMKEFFWNLRAKVETAMERQEGQGLVEYALILVLIAVVVIGAVTLIGQHAQSTFSTIASDL